MTTAVALIPATVQLTGQEQQYIRALLPLLAYTHCYPLAVQEPCTRPTRHVINGTSWELIPLDNNDPTPRALPPVVYNRLMYLQAQGVHFTGFLWAEEQGQQPGPNFYPYQPQPTPNWQPTAASAARGAARVTLGLAGMVLDVFVGAATATAATVNALAVLDPLLVGYTPLNGRYGLYTCLGRWEH